MNAIKWAATFLAAAIIHPVLADVPVPDPELTLELAIALAPPLNPEDFQCDAPSSGLELQSMPFDEVGTFMPEVPLRSLSETVSQAATPVAPVRQKEPPIKIQDFNPLYYRATLNSELCQNLGKFGPLFGSIPDPVSQAAGAVLGGVKIVDDLGGQRGVTFVGSPFNSGCVLYPSKLNVPGMVKEITRLLKH